MYDAWRQELWRVLGLSAILILLGLLLGTVFWPIFLGSIGYFFWHLFNIYRLERWLSRGGDLNSLDAPGVWGLIFSRLSQLQQRNRKSKHKLKAILKRFQESTHVLPDATLVLGTGGEIEWFNPAASALLGLQYPQDIGKQIEEQIAKPEFTRFMDGSKPAEAVEFCANQRTGTWVSVRLVPYSKKRYLMVATDITRIHQLDQIRRDFIANVSHELRTPLTVVGGYLETMLDAEENCCRQWNRSLQLMSEQTERMQRIVNDLLLLSRLEIDEHEPSANTVIVPDLLDSIEKEAAMLSQGQQVINVRYDDRLWLQGNADELRSAFSNLLFNAVRYTPQGGKITVRWFADETGAHLVVMDTGVGIEPQHIPRLTERFYRVDVGRSRAQGGTGLGLAIVKHVLQRHHARLDIESEPGRGSSFSCEFPLTAVVHADEQETALLSQK